jgi:hypothetical protein
MHIPVNIYLYDAGFSYFINECAIAVLYVSYFYHVTYYFVFSILFIVFICNIDIVPCACMFFMYIYLCVTCYLSKRSVDLVYDPLNE